MAVWFAACLHSRRPSWSFHCRCRHVLRGTHDSTTGRVCLRGSAWRGCCGAHGVLARGDRVDTRARPPIRCGRIVSSLRLLPRSSVRAPAITGSMSGRVVVLGATGLVGRTVLRLLEERDFPAREVRLLAGPNGGERTIPFRGRAIPVFPASHEGFADSDLAFFTCKNAISQQWAPVARAAGARVVDNSSAFRYDVDVPLVVPEVS